MSKQDKAKELWVVQGLKEELLSAMTSMVEDSKAVIISKLPDQEEMINKMVGVFMERVRAKFGELEELMVRITEDGYTEEELDVLISFYKTPSGFSAMKKGPEIALIAHRIGGKWGTELMTTVWNELYPEIVGHVQGG